MAHWGLNLPLAVGTSTASGTRQRRSVKQACRVHVQPDRVSLAECILKMAETSTGNFIAHGTLDFPSISSASHE